MVCGFEMLKKVGNFFIQNILNWEFFGPQKYFVWVYKFYDLLGKTSEHI